MLRVSDINFIKFVIYIVFQAFTIKLVAQDSNKILGKWSSPIITKGVNNANGWLFSELNINEVSGFNFKGEILNTWSEDSSVIAVSPISGIFYKNYIKFIKSKIIFKVGFPTITKNYWIDCYTCDSITLALKEMKDSLIIFGYKDCSPNCSGEVYYYKLLKKNNHNDSAIKVTFNDSLQLVRSLLKRPIDLRKEKILVKGDSAEIRLYDDGEIDGDKVSLVYNGKLLVQQLTLNAVPYIIKIPILEDKKNILVLYADNLGSKPPNTAFLRIICDGKETSINLSSDYNKSGAVEFVRSKSLIF